MRWIATLTILLALAGGALAAGPDDDYLNIYNQILQADALQERGQQPAAAAKYFQARAALQKFHDTHPGSDPEAVTFRLQYLTDKLKELAAFLPAAGAEAAPKPVAPLTPQQMAAMWQEEIRALTNANAELEMKLKEALSVQPAAVAPDELAKARERIVALEKERDLLSVAAEQQKAGKLSNAESARLSGELAALQKRSTEADKLAAVEIAGLKRKLDETQKRLSDTTTELSNVKSRPAAEKPDSDNVKQLTVERDRLKKELAAANKDMADREARANSTGAAKVKEVEKERDDLQKQLAATMARPPSQRPPAASAVELDHLRARVAALEAAPVPYTAEELAVLKTAPTARITPAPVATKEPSPKVHSARDLPPGVGAMMQDAERDVMAQRYDDAEKKYQSVLQQDQNNIYVLFHLGSAQYAAGRLDDCEKTVHRALALDPEDPGSLYLLGILRFGQNKLDDALDALSRSAALNSTNASTQNYLGCVMAQKGLRTQAEAALRKALELDPGYADAHFNLSLVYAGEKPPSPALARWHYQKALDLGHAKNESLEKMISDEK